LGFSHPVDDEGDEEDVGEGGVDAPVERNPPLLAEPGGVVDTRTVCRPWWVEARVEEWVEKEKKVAWSLFTHM